MMIKKEKNIYMIKFIYNIQLRIDKNRVRRRKKNNFFDNTMLR